MPPETITITRARYGELLAELDEARSTAQRRKAHLDSLIRVVRSYKRERDRLLIELGRPIPREVPRA